MPKSRKQRNILYLPFSYAPEFHIGLARYATSHNWHLNADMVWTGRIPHGLDVDGAVTLLTDDAHGLDFIRNLNRPVVDMAVLRPDVELPRVAKDNTLIGQVGARHFLELGWRHFAFVSRVDNNVCRLRAAGFRDELRRHGFDCRQLISSSESLDGLHRWDTFRRHLLRAFSRIPKPLAVMAYNDYTAAAIINICQSGGLAVPADVGVLGNDNTLVICNCSPVPLSSVEPDTMRVAGQAAALLDAMIDGKPAPAEPILVPPRGVVMRQSTKRYVVADPRLDRALDLIMDNLNHSISLEQIAARVGISRKTLYELFDRELHQLPAEFVRRRRLSLARSLLAQPDATPAEVARLCGMTRPTLLRQFEREFGTPLQAWRSAHQPEPDLTIPEF